MALKKTCETVGRRKQQGGYTLVLFSLSLLVMLGMLGLVLDVGRMFIATNELQTYVDAAALAAVRQLDGSTTGILNAHALTQYGPLGTPSSTTNRMNFSTVAVNQVSTNPLTQAATLSQVTDSYARTFGGTYDTYGTGQTTSLSNTYRFIKVTASVSLPMTLMRVLPGVPADQILTASATGGQSAIPGTQITSGIQPFGPDAHTASDTHNFGFLVNTSYTLKWGNGNTTSCAGDAGFNPGNAPSAHGFMDLGQGNSNSALRDAIMNGVVPPPITVGQTTLSDVPGNRGSSIFTTVAERANQDLDQTSLTVAAYQASLLAGTANGRRVMTVPVIDPNSYTGNGSNRSGVVIGFANFLLDPGSTISGSSGPFCGTYMGPANLSGLSSGGTDGTVAYRTILFK
ncbi:MAG: pilus assembly protein TadG-related protein [Bryobacteraceae bacterium]